MAEQVVGTFNYTSSRVDFTTDINPGADGGVANVVANFEYARTDRAYAQIGHGGYDADNPDADVVLGNSGDISVTAKTGDILLRAGSDDYTSSQIGHGGPLTRGANKGNIDLTAGGSLDLVAGTFLRASASVGHGGYDADGDHNGTICVKVGEHVLLDSTQGTAQFTYTQIGHGQYASTGNIDGAITVMSGLSGSNGGISLLGGLSGSSDQYAQIGHGGTASGATNNNRSGDITLIDRGAGDLKLRGGGAASSYAMIGHGDSANSTGGTRAGNIFIDVAGETSQISGTPTTSVAFIGHDSTVANNGITLGTVQTTLLSGSFDSANFNFNTIRTQGLLGGTTTIGTTNSDLVMDDLVS